ncbi:methyltransferase [Metallosphaera tengchongensis]|uniref:Methyltransferase-like protein 5 n=1 Tax=Metallosphaera tengchongensis TaxID=1532350 RepID=A0A6N0NVZ8_9CREN|nr:METTL5 family protein [Metallosphaera tengchongensis]QKR00395.1 methyltransferase [Metallosphaera tengchongensis]
MTPSSIASVVVWTAYVQGQIEGKRVLDLGCGTGRLCAGVSALGGYCVCVDVDLESLQVARSAFRGMNLEAEFVEADSTSFHGRFDTVVQNPPFGVARKGTDLKFLRTALEVGKAVYSIHKSNPESRRIIMREAEDKGFKAEMIASFYPLTPYYPWHTERVHRFLVDIYAFRKPTGQDEVK